MLSEEQLQEKLEALEQGVSFAQVIEGLTPAEVNTLRLAARIRRISIPTRDEITVKIQRETVMKAARQHIP